MKLGSLINTACALLFALPVFAETEIRIWYGHEHSTALKSIAPQLSKKIGAKIEVVDFYPDQLKQALLSGNYANNLPDLVFVPADFLGMHQQLGFYPFEAELLSLDLAPETQTVGWTDGDLYGIPLTSGNHLMLFYNRNWVEQAPSSWAELVRQADVLEEQSIRPILWYFDEPYWFVPFLGGHGGWPMGDEGLTLNTDAMRRTLAFYGDIAQRWPYLMDPECDHNCGLKQFKQGQTGFFISGDWVYKDLQQTFGEALGVAPLPTIKGQPLTPMFGSYVIAKTAEIRGPAEELATAKLVAYLQGKEFQSLLFEQHGMLPAHQATRHRLELQAGDPQLAGMLAQLKTARPMPTHQAMSIAWVAIGKGLERYLHHDYSAKKAARYMQRLADKELAKRR